MTHDSLHTIRSFVTGSISHSGVGLLPECNTLVFFLHITRLYGFMKLFIDIIIFITVCILISLGTERESDIKLTDFLICDGQRPHESHIVLFMVPFFIQFPFNCFINGQWVVNLCCLIS
jgi:hypothetical protein